MLKRILIAVLIIFVAGMANADKDKGSDLEKKSMQQLPKRVSESGDYGLYVESFDKRKYGGKQFEIRSIRSEIIPKKAYFLIKYFEQDLIIEILIPDGHECRTGHLTAQVDEMPYRVYQDTHMIDRLKVTFLGDDEFMQKMKLGDKLYLEIGTWGKPIKLTVSLDGFADAYRWLTE